MAPAAICECQLLRGKGLESARDKRMDWSEQLHFEFGFIPPYGQVNLP